MRFAQYFAETVQEAQYRQLGGTQLLMELSGINMKSMEHAYFMSFSDGSLMSNLTDKAASALCTQGRKSALSSLNAFRKKAESCILQNTIPPCLDANCMISRWNHALVRIQQIR